MQQDVPEDEDKTVFVILTESERRCIVASDIEVDGDRNLVILDSDQDVVAVFAAGYWKSVIRNKVITD